ncbi:benzaldehyde dehydrogenase [Nitrincola sp. MINF-07-Sa-05]|uniref:benzaldehyde dehydrogenase n=1 Tax=Nitrincola salilacus TaxID=3400273 RepID=UPI003918337F
MSNVDGDSGLLSSSHWEGLIFDGSWKAANGGSAAVIEPATGVELTRTGMGDAADISIAARSAAEAQAEWVKMPCRERAEIFYRAAEILQKDFESARTWIARETGGLFAKGEHEVREAIVILRRAGSMLLDPNQGLVLPSASGTLSFAKRQPLGVIGVISPFNFPLILSLRAVAPALAVGNAVVLKPDPRTPVSGGFIIARAFEQAGLPKGLLHVIPGGADAGESLCTDPHVRMIAFTGSTAIGRRVGELAGRHLKKVMLELGGKSPLIITEDVDLDIAASNAAWGAWFHQGQICMASGKIIVHESIAQQLIERLVAKATHLPFGNPVDGNVALGPIINRSQLERVDAIVKDSVAAGAVLEAGGEPEGPYYRPTVLSGVKPGMRAYNEEFFGPVASIITFRDDEEAISIANDTEYGLAAAVICRSVSRATAIADRLSAGMVHVNDQTVNDECINPFGGRGASGNGGSIGGPADWDEFCQWQWVTVKDAPHAYPF